MSALRVVARGNERYTPGGRLFVTLCNDSRVDFFVLLWQNQLHFGMNKSNKPPKEIAFCI